MSNYNCRLDLKPRKDVDGRIYYVAKMKGPFNLNFQDGVVFLVFTSDQGEEELQIASMDKKDNFDD